MAKIGVGVGEEFPIEDKPEGEGRARQDAGPERGYEDEDPRYAGCGYDRYDWRFRRAEWRARRRAWRRRYRDEMRDRYPPGNLLYYYWGLPGILRIVLTIAAVMLVLRVVASVPLVLIGVAVLAFLYVAHRHHPLRDGPYADYYGPDHGGPHDAPPPEGR